MKKYLFLIFFIILITTLSFQIVSYASSQKPALWPAIENIEQKEDSFIFDINVMVYAPKGVEGELLVAAYDEVDRLLDVASYGLINVSSYEIPGNCSDKTKLGKTFSISLNLKRNTYAEIKAFVLEKDTLIPKIESGKIEYFYNDGDSYVDVGYVLESDHYNHQNGNFYYYYYYDGKFSSVECTFDENFYVGPENSFDLYFYEKFDVSKKYNLKALAKSVYSQSNFPGVKIWLYISTGKNILTRYGFKVEKIRIYL